MDHRPSFLFGAALGRLASRVTVAQPGSLDADLARIDQTLFDLKAATTFFSCISERVLNNPAITIDDAICEDVSCIFAFLSDVVSGRSEYEMYAAVQGFLSAYQQPCSFESNEPNRALSSE